MLLDLIVGGLVVGGIYALIAIGLNLQYGVARVLNLAYGELLMLGGYLAFFGFTHSNLPPLLTALLGVPRAVPDARRMGPADARRATRRRGEADSAAPLR